MKLGFTGLLVGAGAHDPAWNPDRPLRNPQSSGSYESMTDIIDRRRFDGDLFDRLDARFFDLTGFVWDVDEPYVIECGQSEMFFAARTDSYVAMNSMFKEDFTLLDSRCDGAVNSTYLDWVAFDDGAGGTFEVIMASIPLDQCNTTVAFDAVSNEVVFSNTIMNGAYAILQDDNDAANGVHSGITKKSVVDFNVACRYTAVYEDVGVKMETEHAEINQVINVFESNQFEFGIEFVSPDTSEGRMMDNSTFTAMETAEYQVGDAAYFFVGMQYPNAHLYLEVVSCMMISGFESDLGGNLNYTIIDDQCPDVFTNANLIDQYAENQSLISFTMFEFVSDIPEVETQTNHLRCNIRLCLKNPTTEDEMCPSNKENCM